MRANRRLELKRALAPTLPNLIRRFGSVCLLGLAFIATPATARQVTMRFFEVGRETRPKSRARKERRRLLTVGGGHPGRSGAGAPTGIGIEMAGRAEDDGSGGDIVFLGVKAPRVLHLSAPQRCSRAPGQAARKQLHRPGPEKAARDSCSA